MRSMTEGARERGSFPHSPCSRTLLQSPSAPAPSAGSLSLRSKIVSFFSHITPKSEQSAAFLREEGGMRSMTEGARERGSFPHSPCSRILLQSPSATAPSAGSLTLRSIFRFSLLAHNTKARAKRCLPPGISDTPKLVLAGGTYACEQSESLEGGMRSMTEGARESGNIAQARNSRTLLQSPSAPAPSAGSLPLRSKIVSLFSHIAPSFEQSAASHNPGSLPLRSKLGALCSRIRGFAFKVNGGAKHAILYETKKKRHFDLCRFFFIV